jgi:hypothetical protein
MVDNTVARVQEDKLNRSSHCDIPEKVSKLHLALLQFCAAVSHIKCSVFKAKTEVPYFVSSVKGLRNIV